MYIWAITDRKDVINASTTFSLSRLNDIVRRMSGEDTSSNATFSFVMAQHFHSRNNRSELGASFRRRFGGTIITAEPSDDISAAVLVSSASAGNSSLNVLIIDKPTSFETVGINATTRLSSSIIIPALNPPMTSSSSFNTSLFFQPLPEYKPVRAVNYWCGFFNTSSSRWDASGCYINQCYRNSSLCKCQCNDVTMSALLSTTVPCPTNQTYASNGTCISKVEAQVLFIEYSIR